MKKMKVLDLVYMALGAVLITVCAWISIPTTVPFTLQIFAVYFVLGLLGGKRGLISIIVYLLLGAVGVPVFSGMTGGFAKLIGPTGGYLLSYIFVALIYWLGERVLPKKLWARIISMLVGLVVCYGLGTLMFVLVYVPESGTMGFGAALMMCVVPFILPDLAKIALAVALSATLKKTLKIFS